MTKELLEKSHKRQFALIITAIALVLSLVVATVIVSIGIARAGTFAPRASATARLTP